MLGILSTLYALLGVGAGSYLAGSGARSLCRSIKAKEGRRNIPVKKLHKSWLIRVDEAYYDSAAQKYVAKVRSTMTNDYEFIWCDTEQEMRSRIDNAVEYMSRNIDDYLRKVRSRN
jgi:hypothetical protein